MMFTRKLLSLFFALAVTVGVAASAPTEAEAGCIIGGGFTCPASAPASGWCNLIPQSGLVNCWPFDTANTTTGTATDVIGGKNATLTNVTLNGSGPSSHLNNAGVCNGTSSRGDTGLGNLPTSAFSIVAWINEAVTTGNPRFIANDHTDSDNKGFELTAGGVGQAWFGNGTTPTNAQAGSLSASTWTMLTWTYDGTNIKVYKNTTNNATLAFTGPLAAGTNNISFCVNPAYNGDWYNGAIAGVAIYNRALAPSDISTINGL